MSIKYFLSQEYCRLYNYISSFPEILYPIRKASKPATFEKEKAKIKIKLSLKLNQSKNSIDMKLIIMFLLLLFFQVNISKKIDIRGFSFDNVIIMTIQG